jgi:hypothetical protein
MAALTASERVHSRELDQFVGSLPTVAEGFQPGIWRGGPQKGQPKLPLLAKSLVDTSPTISPSPRAISAGRVWATPTFGSTRLADQGA